MKYGMPTLVEFTSILDNVNLAKSNNLDFIELNMDLPYCQLPRTGSTWLISGTESTFSE